MPDDSRHIDAIILAGTLGARRFHIDGREVAKPYLELGGKALVARAVRAALGAQGIGKVYAVGDRAGLERALDPLLPCERLVIVDQGADLLTNCYRAFFLHLLPDRGFPRPEADELDAAAVADLVAQNPGARDVGALFITADLPFIHAEDLERFLQRAHPDAAAVLGLVDHACLSGMQRALGDRTVLDLWKLGALPMRGLDVRPSNLWLVRPLRTQPQLYTVVRDLYEHRWLLKQDGSMHWANWWGMLRALALHTVRIRGRRRLLRGFFNMLPMLAATVLARLCMRLGRWLSWPFRLFIGRRDLEFVGSLLLGATARMAIGRDLGPAIDIDVEESYWALARNGEEGYRRVGRYLAELTGPPGIEEGSAPAAAEQQHSGHQGQAEPLR
ncbi:MAG: NTP transferase domain-containing protein [Deltaproteobacteria bacterium]|nr:NTP transferase domain-containing protein [Deltaproteobacteria bacterium]